MNDLTGESMSEMTDLEICTKIAEIEGLDWIVNKNDLVFFKPDTCKSHICHFDPLDDKALCFELMVKYYIELNIQMDGEWYAHSNKLGSSAYEKDPQRAICMAIIVGSNRE